MSAWRARRARDCPRALWPAITGDVPAPPLPGIESLWRVTTGDPRVTVAVIDGPVDTAHPCFTPGLLRTLPLKGQAPPVCRSRRQGSCNHGTQVASLLFARHGSGPVAGIAPRCRGLVIPVFRDNPLVAGGVLPASQTDLARAIDLALDHGADIINVSAGQRANGGTADPQLVAAVGRCLDRGVLLVAAAGNDGCDCLHVPAALPGVLVVGALDRSGRPAGFSNFGAAYRDRGVLAPGQGLSVATTGGGSEIRSGTSLATPLVAGVAALLLSARWRASGGAVSKPIVLRDLLVSSARGCALSDPTACRRFLAGTLDVERALALLDRGESPMRTATSCDQVPPDGEPETSSDEALAGVGGAADVTDAPHRVGPSSGVSAPSGAPRASGAVHASSPRSRQAASRSQVVPSCEGGCGCGGGSGQKCSCGGGGEAAGDGRPPLVYALGTLSYDFGSQARFDGIASEIVGGGTMPAGTGPIPATIDTASLLEHLDANPHVAESITWTLNLDATPIYAIRPDGPYAHLAYQRLRQFLAEQISEKVRAERVSIPGYLMGSQTLLSGQKVGVVVPDLRGMFNWTIGALVHRAAGKPPDDKGPKAEREAFRRKEEGITNFLQRVYFEVRNLGLEPRDRALNFAATNAFQIERLFGQAATIGLQLDQIDVERSPICRLDSDCWDVVLYFFNPANVIGEARRAYRFTVDVSDIVPVLVGEVREWAVR